MSELYWLYVLGKLHNTFGILAIISGFVCGACVLAYAACLSETGGTEGMGKCFKKATICVFPIIFLISMIGNIFIPDTKTLYVIYGVGGTLDYLKENKTAKQIPDKAILALDKYLNKQLGDNDNKEDK